MTRIQRWVSTLLMGMALVVLSPSQAEAFGNKYRGGLTTEQVACDTLCTAGPLTGGLEGLLEFTMDEMQETNNPDVVTYVGVNTITTDEGTISGTDYGIWNLVTGEFVDVTVFTQGTGAFAGKRGTLIIVGAFDPVTGTGSSNYYALLH